MKLAFVEKFQQSPSIWTFVFEPEKPVDWVAGQSIRLEIETPFYTDERRFTIVNPPHAQDIAISTRLSDSAFKKALQNLRPGDTIDGFAIEGDFVWRESQTPHLLVAGGTGINPFIAMLRDRAHNKLPLNATILHSTKPNESLYTDELTYLAKTHPELTVKTSDHRFTVEDLLQYKTTQPQIWYLSGPFDMVESLHRALLQKQIDNVEVLRDIY